MALQGDLASFALPEVLRLLAGTEKSGRLTVTAASGSGDLWMHEGRLVCGSASRAAHAVEPADVVFELLRLGGGAFSFDDEEQLEQVGGTISVDKALSKAEALVAEWEDLESVVPSVHARLVVRPELEGTEIIVSAEDWRTLAAVGAGTTARRLGDHFEVTDLVACKMVRSLIEGSMVVFDGTEEPEDRPEDAWDTVAEVTVDDDPYAAFEPMGDAPVEEAEADPYAVFGDAGTVLLEEHADALLPEPLPGAGTAFAADELGTVDGRPTGEPAPAPVTVASAPVTAGAELPAPPVAHPMTFESAFGMNGDGQSGWDDAELAALAAEARQENAFETSPFTAGHQADDDRGSLMDFLSSVKP